LNFNWKLDNLSAKEILSVLLSFSDGLTVKNFF